MPPRPAISVVIPARNEERWLPRALASLRRQTFTDFEALVVDDGSRDGTAAVVCAAADADPRVRYLHNDGVGFVAALNTGIARSRGALIARLDADDASRPRRLEQQAAEYARNPRLVALGTYGWRVNELGVRVGRLRIGPCGRQGYLRLLEKDSDVVLTHSSVMFRRDAAECVGGYEQDFHPADDFRLWNRLLAHGEVYALPDDLTLYTLRAGSMSETQAELMLWQVGRASADRRGLRALGGSAVPQLSAAQSTWVARASTRRRLARALVNGRIGESVAILRSEQVSWQEIRRMLARVGGR